MKKAFIAILLFALSAVFTCAQQATLTNTPPDTKTQIEKEIIDLNAELARLNELVKMLEEKNKLKAQIELLKKQVQSLQQPVTVNPETVVEQQRPLPTNNLQTVQTSSAVVNAGRQTSGSQIPATTGANNLTPADSPQEQTCLDMALRKESYSNYEKTLCDLALKLVRRKFANSPGQPSQIVFSNDRGNLQGIILSKVSSDEQVKKFILEAENARTDKQLGAGTKSAGSTSLLVKGGMPRFLSWAIENGAAEGSRDGTTLTFRINPTGLLNAIAQPNYINQLLGQSDFNFQSPENTDGFSKILRNVSLGFSFDIKRGVETPTFIGSKQQLSAVSVRYQFINKRDPTSRIYREDWQKFAENVGSEYLSRTNLAWNALIEETDNGKRFNNQTLQKWLDDTNRAIAKATVVPTSETDKAAVEEMLKILEKEAAKLESNELKKDSNLSEASAILGTASLKYAAEKRRILEKIQKGDVLSAEYTNYREVNAPDLSNFRIIAQKSFLGSWDLLFNGSLTFFNKKPTATDVKRIRDFDFGLEMETKLRDLGFGQPTFSFAGKYQRLASNISDALGIVQPDTKGDVAYGQLKIVFPIFGTGIKLPFSLTFANRSELIKEKKIGANFGFTFDFDQLFLRGLPF
jgi:hypothetical protein